MAARSNQSTVKHEKAPDEPADIPVVVEWAGSGLAIGSTTIKVAELHALLHVSAPEHKTWRRGLVRARGLQYTVYELLKHQDTAFLEKHGHWVCLKICAGHGGCELTPSPACFGPNFECAPETLTAWTQLLKLQRMLTKKAQTPQTPQAPQAPDAPHAQEPEPSLTTSETHQDHQAFSVPLVLSVSIYDEWDVFAYLMLHTTHNHRSNLKTCFSGLLYNMKQVYFGKTPLHVDMFQHRGICLALCKMFYGYFEVPEVFRDDELFMRACPAEMHFLASERLRSSRDFACFAFQRKRSFDHSVYKHLSPKLRECKDLLQMAVWSEGSGVLQYASDELRDSEDIVLALFSKSACVIKHASQRLQKCVKMRRTCIALVRKDELESLRSLMFTEAELLKYHHAQKAATEAFPCNDPNPKKRSKKPSTKPFANSPHSPP